MLRQLKKRVLSNYRFFGSAELKKNESKPFITLISSSDSEELTGAKISDDEVAKDINDLEVEDDH